MINLDRERRYLDAQARRPLRQKLREGAGEIFDRARHRAETLFDKDVEIVYGFPVRQDRLMQYVDASFVKYIPNPQHLDLHGIIQDLIKQKKGTVYDRKRDNHFLRNGRVVIRTDHAKQFAQPGFLSYDSRAHVITGSETLVSTVLGTSNRLEFTRLEYREQPGKAKRHIRLLERGQGKPRLLHEIFDQLPNPIPAGAVVNLSNSEYTLQATVLPIPDEFIVPQVVLLGPAERSNLDRMLTDTRETGGRVVVVFKEGHEGIMRGFVRPSKGYDIYELTDANKKKVKYINHQEAPDNLSLPDVTPGVAQIVLMPISGKVEDAVREGTEDIDHGLFHQIEDTVGIFGIDVVEKGNSAAKVSLIPIKFRDDGVEHINGNTVLSWHEAWAKNPQDSRFHNYTRTHSIMSVQPVLVNVRKHNAPK